MKKRKPDPKYERSDIDCEVRPVGRPGNIVLPEFPENTGETVETDGIGQTGATMEIDGTGATMEIDETGATMEADGSPLVIENKFDSTDPDIDENIEADENSPEAEKTNPAESINNADNEDAASISATVGSHADEESSNLSPSLSFVTDEPVLFRNSDELVFPEADDDDPDLQGLSAVRISSDATIFEPRVRKLSWLKPRHIITPLIAIAVVLLVVFVILVRDKNVRTASPLLIRGIAVSNAEFNFMYNFVLIENGVDVLSESSREMLNNPVENGSGTYRDLFLDMTAKEMQTVSILFDDAVTHGFSVEQSQKDRAQLYLDWLNQRAAAMSVDSDTFIKATFGKNVTAELIMEVLSKKYFTEDYAYGPKMEELRATEDQAEEAYSSSSNQYDQVSYRLLRIVFEQKDASFIATAHLHAREIIEKIERDQSKFEPVAAEYFSGEAKERLLQPDSTLITGMRFNELVDLEWRVWLFDPERNPGDCTIFEDEDGFPILLCFSARDRQVEPLRSVRIFYLNREDPENGVPGIPAVDIVAQSRIVLDSITDEASMQALETVYAENIALGIMVTSQSSDIYPGKLDPEFDKWIFNPNRKPGDKTAITTDDGIAILFYVDSSTNPEWYDRVNSFIRINNFQEFLLAKQEEYPYRFNEEGLKDI